MKTFTVWSSAGHLVVNKKTGEVIHFEEDPATYPLFFHRITVFDIKEYKEHWGIEEMPDDVDILLIGYNYKGRNDINLYEAPRADAREDAKRLMEDQKS